MQAPALQQQNTVTLHGNRVWNDLLRLGAGSWAMWHSEAGYLGKIIHADEQIGGFAYGYRGFNFCFLVATDRRVIYLDKKPLFIDQEEVTYGVVSGVDFDKGFIGSTLILHTRIKDYKILTFNSRCSEGFVEYIERRVLEQPVTPSN